MIDIIKKYTADCVDPYRNLAVEEYLLHSLKPGECILYLWQNAKTVVIGRNQNAYKECFIEKLLRDGGFIARRLSGGGCVYHDMGNQNFTFLACEEDYDVSRQLSVIIKALEDFNVYAEKTGRNDICVNERKFSGNAFCKHKGRCYHHGTILVDVDMSKMSEYLSVSAVKLKSKGVESVKSRVINLKELNPEIDIAGISASLSKAFGEVYGAPPIEISSTDLDAKTISELYEKYASSEWIYGKHMKADYCFGEKFPWGEIEFELKVRADRITSARVFSDSMDAEIAQKLSGNLAGVFFNRKAVLEAIAGNETEITEDICELFKNQEIWHI